MWVENEIFFDLSYLIFFKIFVTKSYDATTHFETTCENIMEVYKQVTGKDFDFSSCKVRRVVLFLQGRLKTSKFGETKINKKF